MPIDHLVQDLRYALRSMLHNKGFTALAALSLALGIGANTAIYSFTEAILLRSLPVPQPESLVVMKWRVVKQASTVSGISFSTRGINTQFPYPALELFRQNSAVLASAFAYFAVERLDVTIDDETEAVKGQYVSGEYFRGIGVPPAAGRLLLPADDEAAGRTVAVLSHRYGTRRFGDPGRAVGRIIRINEISFSVVGVAPPGFFGAEPGAVPDVYVPLRTQVAIERIATARHFLDHNYYWIEIMGRLAPGVGLAQAQAVLGPQFRRYVEASATTERQRSDLPELTIVEGAAGLDSLRRRYAKPIYVLTAIVGVILLIACANVANLLLVRASARRQEIAVRLGLGASRMRVVRQLLTESALLSSLGGLLGLGFAWWGIRVLTLLLANGRENFTLHAELNWNVLGVTLILSVFTGVLFGLAPAIQATRADVMPALKEVRAFGSGTARRTRGRQGMSQTLVVAQIALSLVLLVAAGLFGGTLSNLHAIELGFNRENVLLFTIRPRAAGYQGAALARLYHDLTDRLRGVPGVRSVSLSSRPLPAGGGTLAPVTLVGAPPSVASGDPAAQRAGVFTVGPAFFETMQIPLAAGREFDDRDGPDAPRVAIVNQRLGKALGLANPVGSRISFAGAGPYEIVGVVGDALFLFLKEDRRGMVYFPYLQGAAPPSQMTYEVRAAGKPLALAGTVRQIVRQVDSRLAVSDLKTQAAHIDQAINQEIALARLCTAFAALALAIACVGLYGTVAFTVSRRTSEIGIRMALGAQRVGIVWLFLRSVFTLELIGLAIGVSIALVGSRYVETLLFGITPNDLTVIAAGAAVLFITGLAAGYLPARRAAGIDPIVALRHE